METPRQQTFKSEREYSRLYYRFGCGVPDSILLFKKLGCKNLGEVIISTFKVAIFGAVNLMICCGVEKHYNDFTQIMKDFMNAIPQGDYKTMIKSTCKLAAFDVFYRPNFIFEDPNSIDSYKRVNPDEATIENMCELVRRSLIFLEDFGPVISTGFDFSPNGYTSIVNAGDGDFLTHDTLWDMKVHKSHLKSEHALQVLMYWIMGQHSGQEIFKGINKIGLYNPRSHTVYILEVSKIAPEIIRKIEREVICYE